ncbi:MAG: IMP cyclohydrolase [Candidatus Bathyarchaeota archaeon]
MSKKLRRMYRTKIEEGFPKEIKLTFGSEEVVYRKAMSLRYGENPHQPAALYAPEEGPLTIGGMEILKTGKGGLSMTNVEDINNSLRIVGYFEESACAVMKHINPSGVAKRNTPEEALKEIYVKARDCDAQAAFGSVVGFNTEVDTETAKEIMSTYVEAVVAPGYKAGCMEYFQRKKNFRVIQVGDINRGSRFSGDPLQPLDISVQTDGSVILQAPMLTKIRGPKDLEFVTERKATSREAKDLIFSWYVCMNVRSNGVVLSKNEATLGIGTGQQDRVTAVRLALEKTVIQGHGEAVPGSVLASDGFFPFRDSIDLLAEYGVSACVQPGGSIRDNKVIGACNEHGIAMAFTGERCFSHF